LCDPLPDVEGYFSTVPARGVVLLRVAN